MWHLKLQNKLICFLFKYSNCTFLSTFLFQRDEEREKQRQKQKKEREKLNKNRNLEELVDDANKRQQEFEKKVYNLWKLLALFGQRFCKSFHNGTAFFSKKKPEGSNLFVYTQMLGYLLTCIAQTNVFFSYAYTLHFYSSHNHFCLEKRELQY